MMKSIFERDAMGRLMGFVVMQVISFHKDITFPMTTNGQAYQMIEKMRARKILIGPYVDQHIVETIYQVCNLPKFACISRLSPSGK